MIRLWLAPYYRLRFWSDTNSTSLCVLIINRISSVTSSSLEYSNEIVHVALPLNFFIKCCTLISSHFHFPNKFRNTIEYCLARMLIEHTMQRQSPKLTTNIWLFSFIALYRDDAIVMHKYIHRFQMRRTHHKIHFVRILRNTIAFRRYVERRTLMYCKLIVTFVSS